MASIYSVGNVVYSNIYVLYIFTVHNLVVDRIEVEIWYCKVTQCDNKRPLVSFKKNFQH